MTDNKEVLNIITKLYHNILNSNFNKEFYKVGLIYIYKTDYESHLKSFYDSLSVLNQESKTEINEISKKSSEFFVMTISDLIEKKLYESKLMEKLINEFTIDFYNKISIIYSDYRSYNNKQEDNFDVVKDFMSMIEVSDLIAKGVIALDNNLSKIISEWTIEDPKFIEMFEETISSIVNRIGISDINK